MSQLSALPPSPYWEEAALGYDAYSILKTGKDHHGNTLPIVAFESFGDFKPSLYFYAAVPSIAIFGLNTLAVRLPSALAGIITVWLVYLLVKELTIEYRKNSKPQKKISLTFSIQHSAFYSAFFLAIMPWHILVSRVAFETNLGLLFVTLGTYLWLRSDKNNQINQVLVILSTISFGLSLYAYHGLRVFTPLIMLVLLLQRITPIKPTPKSIIQSLKPYLVSMFVFTVLMAPILIKLSEPQITQRFAQTSAFATLDPILQSNQAIQQDGGGIIARLIHHRYWYYSKIYLENYLSHFTIDFLFLSGDSNPRHSTGFTGQLMLIQLPLIIIGLIAVTSNPYLRKRFGYLIISWMLISPIAAGATIATPHALRSLPMVIPLAIVSGIGLYQVFVTVPAIVKKTNYNPITNYQLPITVSIIVIGITIPLVELIRFWYHYNNVYPYQHSSQWQYGYQSLIQYINEKKHHYDTIQMTRDQGRPAMYYWFYSQTDPQQVQQWNTKAPKDQGEYLQYENLYFGINPQQPGKTLQIDSSLPENATAIKTINSLDNKPVFYIYE